MDNSEMDRILEKLATYEPYPALYEPYPAFRHIDTRDRYVGIEEDDLLDYSIINSNAYREHANNVYYDEFVDPSIVANSFLDRFNSYQPGYTLDFDPADYEVVWENGTLKIVKKEKNAPDFGELSPSQELNDFVDTLVLGK